MSEEDKQLLLQDLCARLPYGVKVEAVPYTDPQLLCSIDPIRQEYRLDFDMTKSIFHRNWVGEEVSNIKPYLRRLSSMTEDERRESMLRYGYREIDYYNEHHFDYRHLIDRGLAIEVTEENNPYKSN